MKEKFTTVTPLSKVIAGVIFVALPFSAFYLGVLYQQNMDVDVIETKYVENEETTETTVIEDQNTDDVEEAQDEVTTEEETLTEDFSFEIYNTVSGSSSDTIKFSGKMPKGTEVSLETTEGSQSASLVNGNFELSFHEFYEMSLYSYLNYSVVETENIGSLNRALFDSGDETTNIYHYVTKNEFEIENQCQVMDSYINAPCGDSAYYDKKMPEIIIMTCDPNNDSGLVQCDDIIKSIQISK